MPNYNTEDEKAQMLGYSVRKLLLTHLGIIKETDRDSYSFKRIDTAGSLLLELYRELFGIFQRNFLANRYSIISISSRLITTFLF